MSTSNDATEPSSGTQSSAQPQLRKAISIPLLLALAAATILGPWLIMVNWWFSLTGPSLSFAFLITLLLMIPIAYCYSELASTLPYAGGSYNYIGHAFNTPTAFLFSWSQTISYFAVIAFNVLATVIILQYANIIPTAAAPVSIAGITLGDPYLISTGIIFAAIFAILNWYKIELSAKLQFGLFLLLFVTGMIWNGFDLFASPSFSLSYFSNFFPYGLNGFLVATGVMVTMYFGFEVVANMSEEANFPPKKTPLVVIGALVIAGIVYIVTLTAMAGVAPLSYLVNTSEVPGQIIYLVHGHIPWATIGWIGIVLGAIACAVTTFDGFWLALSRLWYALGRSNLFPTQIGKLNRHSVPGFANLLIFVGVLPLLIFSGTEWIAGLFVIMGISIAVVYLGTSLSFIQLRRKHADWKRPYKAPGGLIMGILGAAASGFCIYWSAVALTPTSAGGTYTGDWWTGWGLLIGYMIVGGFVYLYMSHYRRKRNLETLLCKTPECEMELPQETEPRKS